MKTVFAMILLFLIFVVSPEISNAQDLIRLEIVKQERVVPFYTHLGKIDRKVYYRLINNSQNPIILYGSSF